MRLTRLILQSHHTHNPCNTHLNFLTQLDSEMILSSQRMIYSNGFVDHKFLYLGRTLTAQILRHAATVKWFRPKTRVISADQRGIRRPRRVIGE